MDPRVITAGVLAAALLSGTPAALAAYPERPLRVIALNPPGGVSDTVARTVGEKLSERFGQPVIVDNRVGASGIIGSEIVAKAQPDGHTLLLGFIGNLSINPGLFKKLPYDPQKDFLPISVLARSPIIVAVNPSISAKSISELVALAKAQPGKITYSSSGNGNGNHLATELFGMMAGIDLLHVPFRGGPPALSAVIRGDTKMMLGNAVFTVPQVKAGRVRAVAVTTGKRLGLLPEVPTVAESGYPEFVVTTWFGILAPARTPAAIVQTLHTEIIEILKDANVQQRLDRVGLIPATSTPEEFAKLIRSETVRWGNVIRKAGVKAD